MWVHTVCQRLRSDCRSVRRVIDARDCGMSLFRGHELVSSCLYCKSVAPWPRFFVFQLPSPLPHFGGSFLMSVCSGEFGLHNLSMICEGIGTTINDDKS